MRDDFRLLSLCARMRCPQHSLWILMAAQSKTGHYVTRPWIWDCVDSMRALATQFLIHGSRIKFLSLIKYYVSGSIRIEIDESPIFFLVFFLSYPDQCSREHHFVAALRLIRRKKKTRERRRKHFSYFSFPVWTDQRSPRSGHIHVSPDW